MADQPFFTRATAVPSALQEQWTATDLLQCSHRHDTYAEAAACHAGGDYVVRHALGQITSYKISDFTKFLKSFSLELSALGGSDLNDNISSFAGSSEARIDLGERSIRLERVNGTEITLTPILAGSALVSKTYSITDTDVALEAAEFAYDHLLKSLASERET